MRFDQRLFEFIILFTYIVQICIVEKLAVDLDSHFGSSDGILPPLLKHGQKDIVTSTEFRV
jgi:hypothetical protein